MGKHPFNPDYGVHPGEMLKDELEARGIEPDGEMQAVLDGGTLSDALAERLEGVTGLKAHVWKNLMRQYYEWALARIWEIFDQESRKEREEFTRLVEIVSAYDDEHYPIGPPTLEGMIEFWEDQRFDSAADLKEVAGRLQKLYTDEEVVEWLWAKNELLGGKSAVRLLQDGRKSEVLALLDRIEAGAYL